MIDSQSIPLALCPELRLVSISGLEKSRLSVSMLLKVSALAQSTFGRQGL
jgi:hypothetical protein